MLEKGDILKWNLEGPILKKVKLLRDRVLNKNEDAVGIPDGDLHITLAAGPIWSKVKREAKDMPEPDFKMNVEPSNKVAEEGPKKSWYVKLKNQNDWKNFLYNMLGKVPNPDRVYHISLANLTGNKRDSVAIVEEYITEDITKSDLDQVEKYADRLFAAVGIDVEFTRHFLDRVNDERNKKPISTAELIGLFKKTYKKHGKKIPKLDPDTQAVVKDMKRDINMPFVINIDKNGMLNLVAKTIMRKKDFRTSNMELPV